MVVYLASGIVMAFGDAGAAANLVGLGGPVVQDESGWDHPDEQGATGIGNDYRSPLCQRWCKKPHWTQVQAAPPLLTLLRASSS